MRTGLNGIGIRHSFSKRVQLEPDMLPIISDSATNLVAWYDFSDGTTMFENAAGSDPAEDGDRIQYAMSALISLMVDNGNNPYSAKLGFFTAKTISSDARSCNVLI